MNTDMLGQGVLVLFFFIFAIVLVYALRKPASEIEALSNLPLATEDKPLESRGGSHA